MGLDEQNNMLFKITSYLTWGKKKRTTLIEIKEKQLEGKNAENSISGRRKKKDISGYLFFQATTTNKALSYLLFLGLSITPKNDDLQGVY